MNSNNQKIHNENIHEAYEAHYFDDISNNYQQQFIFNFLFLGLDNDYKKWADLASGSGGNTFTALDRFLCLAAEKFDIS